MPLIDSIPRGRALEMIRDIARGLAYMHNIKPSPIVHRDLKPGNILITGLASKRWCAKKSHSVLFYHDLMCEIRITLGGMPRGLRRGFTQIWKELTGPLVEVLFVEVLYYVILANP